MFNLSVMLFSNTNYHVYASTSPPGLNHCLDRIRLIVWGEGNNLLTSPWSSLCSPDTATQLATAVTAEVSGPGLHCQTNAIFFSPPPSPPRTPGTFLSFLSSEEKLLRFLLRSPPVLHYTQMRNATARAVSSPPFFIMNFDRSLSVPAWL